jgi:hypothetical protein
MEPYGKKAWDVKRVQINVDNTNNRLNNIDLSRKFTADYSKLEI